MLTVLNAIYNLQWRPCPKFHPLPAHITRTFVSTAGGDLELLVSHPKNPDPSSPPIIFAHGGFGHASIWIDWMTYFHNHYGGSTYAYSARNHGASYPVSYLKMVWGTSIDDIASDWASVIYHVKHQLENDTEPVLVAHSAGGALTQFVLTNYRTTTRGLCLLGAVPHFGAYDVYWNWAKADPWFIVRNFFSGGHPTSPLSYPALVYNVFFGPRFPKAKDDRWAKVKEFISWMPGYESMGWPMATMGSFWKWLRGRNEWLPVPKILASITGWERSGDKVCIMVGSHDRLMDLNIADRQFREYADAVGMIQEEKRLDASASQSGGETLSDGVRMKAANKVRLVIVHGAGHHTQNDIQWETAAEECRKWVQQL